MNLQAQWIVGFTDGEGCFHIDISDHPEMTPGSSQSVQILPELAIVQHERDVQVLHAIKKYFGCGVVRRTHGDRMCWRVRKLEHLRDRILPFFEKHNLKTRKHQDFLAFRRVVRAMGEKKHLTPEGLEQIRRTARRMRKLQGSGGDEGMVKPSSS